MMTIWVGYERPKDFPGTILVARKWQIEKGKSLPTEETLIFESIEQAHEYFETMGLVFVARSVLDDDCILGSWL